MSKTIKRLYLFLIAFIQAFRVLHAFLSISPTTRTRSYAAALEALHWHQVTRKQSAAYYTLLFTTRNNKNSRDFYHADANSLSCFSSSSSSSSPSETLDNTTLAKCCSSTSTIQKHRKQQHSQNYDQVLIKQQQQQQQQQRDYDYTKIRKGEIYVQRDFLNTSQIIALQNDIHQLRTRSKSASNSKSKLFQPSGLSNRIQGDENVFDDQDRLTCTITPDLWKGNGKGREEYEYSNIRSTVEEKLEQLKEDLQRSLSLSLSQQQHHQKSSDFLEEKSESKAEADLNVALELELELAEMYYSISPTGSSLPRHQDERHEDTKGAKAWINETRRSISWLIYLNDSEWGSGGELRAYCRTCCSSSNSSDSNSSNSNRNRNDYIQCGSHEGDIQVGWLRCAANSNTSTVADSDSSNSSISTATISMMPNTPDIIEYEPIFLDSWVKTPVKPKPAPRLLDNRVHPDQIVREKEKEEDSIDDDEEYYEDDDSHELKWQPMSALYRIRRNIDATSNTNMTEFDSGLGSGSDSDLDSDSITHTSSCSSRSQHSNSTRKSYREYLSPPFGPNSPSWPSEPDLDPIDFAKALGMQLTRKDHQDRFIGTEDIDIHTGTGTSAPHDSDSRDLRIVDILPTGGTLVLFDSVAVPHEVLEVRQGTRLAIAGWFHERQQDFPDWYGT